MAYKAQVEPLASPLKKTKLDSASDNIIQEVWLYSFWEKREYFVKGQLNRLTVKHVRDADNDAFLSAVCFSLY